MKKRSVIFEDVPSLMEDLLIQMQEMNDRMKRMENKLAAPAPANSERELITTAEVCKLLKITRITVYRMINRGDIPCYRNGKILLFYKDEILKWVSSRSKNSHLSIRTANECQNLNPNTSGISQ